jgi:oxygen-independent coproporphyrinogen-3 oxidase
LEIHDLESLINGLRQRLCLSTEAETTLEANPDDISPSKLASFRSLGIDRISLGVQSLNERSLRLLGRRHSAKAAENSIEETIAAGFPSVGVDLIYGTPDQTDCDWLETLEKVVSHGPHHISCYQLTLSNNTPLDELRRKGRLNLPNDDTLADLFLLTSETLESKGYVHYEISNFALPGHLSRHNSKYWRRIPYLGLGPAAHSFVPPFRWWNPRSLDVYGKRLTGGRHPFEQREVLSPDDAFLESLGLGFRTREGVSLHDLPYEKAEGVVDELRSNGLIEIKGERIIPTRKGFLVADSLPLLFLD